MRAKQTPMAGQQCFKNRPTLSSAVGSGKVQVFGGLSSYISGIEDSHCAVILVSDVYGYEGPNLRKLADKIGAAGFYIVVPDLLAGDPYKPGVTKTDWINNHGTDKDSKMQNRLLKSKGISKIGAAGFCWGGTVYEFDSNPEQLNKRFTQCSVSAKVVDELAKEPYIQAAVLLHPSRVSLEDTQGMAALYTYVVGCSTSWLEFVEGWIRVFRFYSRSRRK